MSVADTAQRGLLLHDDDFTIAARYQAGYAGRVHYYLPAQDPFRLGRLHWVMETSLPKTVAGKRLSTVGSMARKHRTVITTGRAAHGVPITVHPQPGQEAPGHPLRRDPTV